MTKRIKKTLKNYPIVGHTDQFVKRKQLKIYKERKKEKKKRWEGEEVAIYQWLLEFHIIMASEESGLMERHIVKFEIE